MAYIIARITGEPYEVVLARYRTSTGGGIRYNIAPSQENTVIDAKGGNPAATRMKWGHFASFKPGSPPAFLINARSETVLEKRTFARAMNERRCLVPADGFYEWKRDEKGRAKQAYYFQRRGGAAFYLAGLYWPAAMDQPEGYIVLTTAPNELLGSIHDRMPVMLTEETAKQWIDPAVGGEAARALCPSFPAADMTAYPVGSAVNSARNDTPECIVPVMTAGPRQEELF